VIPRRTAAEAVRRANHIAGGSSGDLRLGRIEARSEAALSCPSTPIGKERRLAIPFGTRGRTPWDLTWTTRRAHGRLTNEHIDSWYP
jgi:hypothetical protein